MFEACFGEKLFSPPVIVEKAIEAASASPVRARTWDGEKFHGGYGETQLLTMDYWTIRRRSSEVFKTNLYARGIIRRMVTNEINTGLALEAMPIPALTGLTDQLAMLWSEQAEVLFGLWGDNAEACDHLKRQTFGELQATIRAETLIEGDGVLVLLENQKLRLPSIQWISGNNIQTPWMNGPLNIKKGHKIVHGVELDHAGRHVAYWAKQEDDTFKRIPAFGEKSGKRIAWMVYGCDKRHEDVRGEPILSLILQSLKEIDRYRDSTQRKATINSLLAMFIERTADKAPSGALTGAAVRKGSVTVVDNTADTAGQSYQVNELSPGTIVEKLEIGETIKGFPSHGTDEKFGEFEEAVIQAIAWSLQIPPEILRLSFSNNYSASQAAINEFKIYLEPVRKFFGAQVCQPIYREWLICTVLNRTLKAVGFIEAWRESNFYVFAGWLHSDWAGHVKPSTDTLKQAKGIRMMLEDGLITGQRAAREINGTKWSQNIAIRKREIEMMKDAGMTIAAMPTEVAPDEDDLPTEEEEDETSK